MIIRLSPQRWTPEKQVLPYVFQKKRKCNCCNNRNITWQERHLHKGHTWRWHRGGEGDRCAQFLFSCIFLRCIVFTHAFHAFHVHRALLCCNCVEVAGGCQTWHIENGTSAVWHRECDGPLYVCMYCCRRGGDRCFLSDPERGVHCFLRATSTLACTAVEKKYMQNHSWFIQSKARFSNTV